MSSFALGGTVLHALAYLGLVLGCARLVRTCLVGFLASFGLHLVGVFLLLALGLTKVDAIHDGILDFVV